MPVFFFFSRSLILLVFSYWWLCAHKETCISYAFYIQLFTCIIVIPNNKRSKYKGEIKLPYMSGLMEQWLIEWNCDIIKLLSPECVYLIPYVICHYTMLQKNAL